MPQTTYRYMLADEIKRKIPDAAGVAVSGVVRLDRGVLLVQTPDVLSTGDKAALDAYLVTLGYAAMPADALTLRDPRYQVDTVAAGQVTRTDWYQVDNGGGVFADLARTDVNTWTASKLVSTTTTLYYTNGSTGPTWTDDYYTNGVLRIRKRR